MKFVYPSMNAVFETEGECLQEIVIENQKLLLELLEDIANQLSGLDGNAVVSQNNKLLAFDKCVELLSQFVPFDLNKKTLLNRILAELERNAVEEHYAETLDVIGALETYLQNLAFDFRCDISFTKVNVNTLLKSSGLEIYSDYDNLGEKLIDYMELVREFEREKLFIFLNLRSYLTDEEIQLFAKTVLSHGFSVILLESSEHPWLPELKRYIVDRDLCEIE